MIGEVIIEDAKVLEAFKRAPGVMMQSMGPTVDRVAKRLVGAIKQELAGNHSYAAGTLTNAIRDTLLSPAERIVMAGEPNAPIAHAEHLEFGTKPRSKRPAVSPLVQWIAAKEGGSEKELMGRALRLADHIRDHGTEPHPFFKPAFEKNESQLTAMLRRGVESGVARAMKD